MEKVQNILSDEESMKQIKELADMLSAPSENSSATNNNSVPDLSSLFSALGANTNNSQQSKANTANSEQPDLTSLLSAFGNSNNNMPVATTPQSNNNNNGLGIDFGTIMKLQGLMQTASQNDKTTDLLIALKPLLNEKRQVKVDKAVKLMKIWALYNVAKDSGIINIDKLL